MSMGIARLLGTVPWVGTGRRRGGGMAVSAAAPAIPQAAWPLDRPAQCDWSWRPSPWTTPIAPSDRSGVEGGTLLAPGITLFHDCRLAEITVRQVRPTHPDPAAPFTLMLDTLGFSGSFLSLALDLPVEAARSMRSGHVVAVTSRVTSERRGAIFARLNLRHGPNVEQIVSELIPVDAGGGQSAAEFDLVWQDINPAKLEAAWIDLIFEKPEMNAVRIEDLVLTRRPRADI